MKLKISTTTRPAMAGKQMGEAIVENVHLLYLNDNALEYMQGLVRTVLEEFERRKASAKIRKANAK